MDGETLFATSRPWQDPRFLPDSYWDISPAHHALPAYQHLGSGPAHHPSHANPMAAFNDLFHHQQFRGPVGGYGHYSYGKPSSQPAAYSGLYLKPDHVSSYQVYQPVPLQPQQSPRFHANTMPQQPYQPTMALPYAYGFFPQHVAGYNMQALQSSATSGAGNVVVSSCKVCKTQLTPPKMAQHPSPPALPRGPPRKPKRSGNAIWVGNIPLGASIEALKDHFSREATADLESVFLMGKSNCAFVNYKTEDACSAAVERFNHSLFGSVRLLCRLRRDSTSSNAGHPLSKPASERSDSVSPVTGPGSDRESSATDRLSDLSIAQSQTANEHALTDHGSDTQTLLPNKPTDRYFIVKSLTKEDLQDSLQKGTWETQSHNQKTFGDAFRDAENVYLIFSVNKSGEYFGYARMISSPLDKIARDDDNPPDVMMPSTTSPRAGAFSTGSAADSRPTGKLHITRTAATDSAPKGYIIDDPARGTLFWEAEYDDHGIVSSAPLTPEQESESQALIRSRPFKVEWLSVRRVTFQRAKGIRNPWNANKEVKVARDGTELETEVGRRVVRLFHENYADGTAGRKGP